MGDSLSYLDNLLSMENMVMIFVRKRSVAMSGLRKSLLKLGCQFDA